MKTGIDINRISAAVGYRVEARDTRTVSPNAPIRIGVLAEVSTAMDAMTTPPVDLTPWVVTNIRDAGIRYGYNSPILQILDTLMPIDGSGVSANIIEVYPLKLASGAVAKQTTITITGTATSNAEITIYVCGQSSQRGKSYTVSIVKGDTPTIVAGKIRDVLNNNVYCPYTATSTLGVVTATVAWKGKSSDYCNIEVDVNNVEHGLTYVVANPVSGSGLDVTGLNTALGLVGDKWVNIFVTGLSWNESTYLSAHQDWNGKPDNINPTGRFASIVNKPALFYVGATEDDISSVTDSSSYRDYMTNVSCTLPNEKYLPSVIAASYALLTAKIAQVTPHRDLLGLQLPNIKCRYGLGSMSNTDTIDDMVKKGMSTIEKSAGGAYIKDFVTTFHPLNDDIPSYRFVRNVIIDWQVLYRMLIYTKSLQGYTLVSDEDIIEQENVTKPSLIKSDISTILEELGKIHVLTKVEDAVKSIVVATSSTNPDRVGINLDYTRSGTIRIADTVASAGFNFGTI